MRLFCLVKTDKKTRSGKSKEEVTVKKFLVVLLIMGFILFLNSQAIKENPAKSWSIADDTFECLGSTKAKDGESSQITIYREKVSNVLYVAQWQTSGTSLTVMVDPDSVYRPLTWARYQQLAQQNGR